MRQNLSKAFDMKFNWVKDRIKQKRFQLIWRKRAINMADYFTKHHPPWHYKKMRHRNLHKGDKDDPPASLGSRGQGCITQPSGVIPLQPMT